MKTISSPELVLPESETASEAVFDRSYSIPGGNQIWIDGEIISLGLGPLLAPGMTLLRVNSNV